MPCDYGSRHPPARRSYTKEEKEDLGIEQEEEDAEIWVSRIEAKFDQAITLKLLQDETDLDEELKKLKEELHANRNPRRRASSHTGKYTSLWGFAAEHAGLHVSTYSCTAFLIPLNQVVSLSLARVLSAPWCPSCAMEIALGCRDFWLA